jgi:hypothetical protein
MGVGVALTALMLLHLQAPFKMSCRSSSFHF